ncbi:MAG: hypothetical protein OSA97_12515 [Nevskia sp.]|nr:hypothetical protein [Nevskia sp.]
MLAANILNWRALNEERALLAAADQRLSKMGAPSRLVQLDTALNESGAPPSRPARWPRESIHPIAPCAVTPTALDVNPVAFQAHLASRLADPATHEALRGQLRGAALQRYGELIKRWRASGVDTERLLDFIADYQLTGMVRALGSGSPASQSTTALNMVDDDVLRALLNPTERDELRAYDATLGDREALSPWLNEMNLAQTPLPADQAEKMIGILHDERAAVPPPEPPPTFANDSGAYAAALADWQRAYDQRVLGRAALILSGDQLSQLDSYQRGQRAVSSLSMAAVSDGNVRESP